MKKMMILPFNQLRLKTLKKKMKTLMVQ